MSLLEQFLDPSQVSLKICGVTTHDDAARLVTMGVDALGVNFWPKSKRYLSASDAAWLVGAIGGEDMYARVERLDQLAFAQRVSVSET